MNRWIWNNINWIFGLFTLFTIQFFTIIFYGYAAYFSCSAPYLFIYYSLAWALYSYFENGRAILFNFVFPIFLALNVLILGTIGFYYSSSISDIINSFYRAANLITLNNSDFSELGQINIQMKIARSLGVFLAAYAFIVAFLTILGPENLGRLRFYLFRNTPFLKTDFSVVIGDSEFIIPLVESLLNDGKRVLVLCGSNSLDLSSIMYERFCWILYGNSFSSLALQKSYFHMSNEIYLLNTNDENTFRSILEMDFLYNDLLKNPQKNLFQRNKQNLEFPFWYLNVDSKSLKDSLGALLETSRLEERNKIVYPFSAYQLAVQNLLIHPFFIPEIDQNLAIINCIHFNVFTKTYIENLLIVYTYNNDFLIEIAISDEYSKKDDIERWIESKSKYSNLTGIFNSIYEMEKSVYKGSKILLKYQEIDFTDFKVEKTYFYENNSRNYKNATLKFLIFGENNISNYQIVSEMLPALNYYFVKHFTNISVGYRMEMPDSDEMKIIEESLKLKGKSVNVHLFGNRFELYKHKKIKNWNWLEGAMLLAYWYEKNLSTKDVVSDFAPYIERAKNHWSTLPQSIKESNLYCFLHGTIKLKYNEFNNSKNEITFQKDIEHRRWLRQYILDGWSPILDKGEIEDWKDNEGLFRSIKMHPMIIDYEKLIVEIQEKDTRIIQIVFFLKQFYLNHII